MRISKIWISSSLIVLLSSAAVSKSKSSGIIVTNTNDSGPGSLREALAATESHPGPDTVAFSIPITDPGYSLATGVWTIKPTTGYYVPSGTTVDGTIALAGEGIISQPRIEIDGTTLALLGITGFRLGDDVTLRSLVVNQFQYGIWIDRANVTIEGCYVGTDPTGTSEKPNGIDGILVANGATGAVIQNNLLSGNKGCGIRLFGEGTTSNTLINNRIGTDINGNAALPNRSDGIHLHAGAHDNVVVDNLISGNDGIGVHLLDVGTSSNILQHNRIGTDISGTEALANGSFGVAFFNGPQNNMVGPGNLVVYNNKEGVLVDGAGSFTSTVGNTITANNITANGGTGIWNFRGGNNEITPPVINSIILNVVSGTAAPGQRVELFADESDEGSFFLGAVTADASGNFSIPVPDLTPALPYFTTTATDAAGNTSEFSQPFNITAVEEQLEAGIPKRFSLSQNYPNPFNSETTINYQLPKIAHVIINIYNLASQQIRTLIDRKNEAGYFNIIWDGRDGNNNFVASGIYLYRIDAISTEQHFIQVNKMVLLK